uniref:Uncharacterized protein n=1 Tax=Moumouvirus sp. 'Monve' TaxID=1128131 RepID=H2ECV5_9VIRU|nr:hypothetical protein mv_R23 [Moumouvirus Monve]
MTFILSIKKILLFDKIKINI